MNNLAFQIYGLKKIGIFQSTWDTTLVSALGTEQAAISATGTNWALNTGATNLNVGGYKHTAGSTTNLTTTLAAVIMQMYKITYTISSRTTGSVTINYGGVSTSGITSSASVDILAIATTVFSITPTSDFDGVISISVKQTSSATNQVKLPLPNSGTYNIWVDWGDGTYDNITSYNSIKTLHTYPTSGTYTVRITGDRFSWTNNSDKLKIKTVSSWGKLKLESYSFNGCSNVTMSGITDVPDLTGVTSLQGTFFLCSKITTIGRINEWNTSNITSTIQMFHSCTLFNSNISNWNVSNVTAFNAMFFTANSFNNGYAPGVVNTLPWITTNATTLNQMFTGSVAFNSNISTFNVSKVVNFYQMFQNANSFNNGYASGVANQLPWTINTVSNVDMSSLFFAALAFNSNLGTGTTPWDVSTVTNFSSMFAGAAKFNNGDESDVTLSKINDWSINTVSAVNMSSMFSSATIFNRNIGSWNVSKVTTFANMFVLARDFNNGGSPSINNWSINTASPVPMNSMFYQAYSFNQPIENWNVTSVNTMSVMFSLALAFNQPLANWERSTPGNTSTLANVTSMSQMFCATIPGTAKFNQNIGNWNVSGVTNFTQMFANLSNGVNPFNNDGSTSINSWQIKTNGPVTMSGMFTKSVFNQPIGDWNVSQVTDMSTMFQSTASFNQDISKWNVGKVTTFTAMFNGATVFNNDVNSDTNPITFRTGINGWNIGAGVASVTTNQMFQNTNFNRYIGDWDVSKVTAMGNMFLSNTSFNQDISKWNMGGVTSMDAMFYGANAFTNGSNTNINLITGITGINGWNINTTATSVTMASMFAQNTAFNQPLDSWNVSKVTNMNGMFYNASAFNKPIGSWNVSSVTNFSNFMFGKTNLSFSSTNLDAIYNGWIVNGVKPNISISFGTAKYTAAGEESRTTLRVSPNNWIIRDGGVEGTVLNLDAGNLNSYPGTGTLWTDLSGNNNNGTLIGGPTFDSANGGSIVFDGTNDYVSSFPLQISGNGSKTVSCFFKINTTIRSGLCGTRDLDTGPNGWALCVNRTTSGNLTYYHTSGSTLEIAAGISTNTWYNACVTYDVSTAIATLYLNGIIIGSPATSFTTINSSSFNGVIGAETVNFSFLNGNIAQTSIYNRALSSTEVLQNYNATKGRFGL